MGKIEKIQDIDVSKLIPYENNAKIHNRMQLEKLKESISKFGFITPCLIDNDFNLIAGHGRVMAAKELNIEKVPCVHVEGLSDLQRKAYILADNKLSELAEWDLDLLNAELNEIMDDGFDISIIGFDMDETIQQEINQGVEIDLDSLGDEYFKYTCPECGFKFNWGD